MSALAIILIVLVALVVALAAGGAIAMARATRARDAELRRQLEEADRLLARAHAEDKGWDRATLEAAARAAAVQRYGAEVTGLQLVQVLDRPGTDADQAVFRVRTDEGEHSITLGRSNGIWGPA